LEFNVPFQDQTRLLYEFGANPFSGSRDISYTNKNHTLTAPKTEPSTVQCVQQLDGFPNFPGSVRTLDLHNGQIKQLLLSSFIISVKEPLKIKQLMFLGRIAVLRT